jgi:hypothetical protein
MAFPNARVSLVQIHRRSFEPVAHPLLALEEII